MNTTDKIIKMNNPRTKHLIGLILLIAIGAFLIRLVQPIDTSILNMQLCFFSGYIVLFTIGIKSYHYHWFEKIHYITGIKWLKAAIVLGFLVFIAIMFFGGALNGELSVFKGGFYWQSFAYSVWESFIGVSMSVGLIVLFREKFNHQNQLVKTLSASAFAVYVFHAPIIVLITSKLSFIAIDPLLKFALMTIICLPICFIIAFIIKKSPILSRVI